MSGVCIGDARKGSGCGYEGGAPGDTCPECNGMILCCADPNFTTSTIGEDYGDRPPRGPEVEETVSTTTCSNCGWKSTLTFTKRAGKPMEVVES